MSNIINSYFNIYDVIFVIILLVSFIISYRNGLLYSVFSFFKVIGSAIGAGYVSNKYATVLYDRFLKDKLVSSVAQKLSDFRDGIISSFDKDIIGKAITEYLSKTSLGGDVEKISEIIVDDGIQNTIVGGIQLFLFIVLFLVILILLTCVQNILLHTNDVPIIGFMNQFLGGVFGILIGLVILVIISMLISVFLDYNASFISKEAVMNSHLFSYIFKLNPFYK